MAHFLYPRGVQGDVVYLSWPIAPLAYGYEPKCGGEGCGVSANENSCAYHVTWRPSKLWRSNSIFNLCFTPIGDIPIRNGATVGICIHSSLGNMVPLPQLRIFGFVRKFGLVCGGGGRKSAKSHQISCRVSCRFYLEGLLLIPPPALIACHPAPVIGHRGFQFKCRDLGINLKAVPWLESILWIDKTRKRVFTKRVKRSFLYYEEI